MMGYLQVWRVVVVEPDQTVLTHPAHTVTTGGLLRASHRLLQQGRDELFSATKQVRPQSPSPSLPPSLSRPVGVRLAWWQLVILVKVAVVVQPELGLARITQNRLNTNN